MNAPKYNERISKFCTVNEGMERYRLGRNHLMQLAEEHRAVRRFGRSVRIDARLLDEVFDRLY